MFAFADNRIIDQNTALKITTGFGGGIAKEGQVCGAFTAGVMLLGLLHGRGLNESESKKEKTEDKVREFIEEFKSRNNSILCGEILNGIDLRTEDGKNSFRQNNYGENICAKCVTTSTEILQKYL